MSRPSDPNARIKLLAAAETVFATHGLEAAKVEEIAQRAGLAKGSFYLHFDSKDDAFRQLVEMMLARLKAQLDALPDEALPAGTTFDQFLSLWVDLDLEMFEFIWLNRAVVGLLLDGGRCAAYRHMIDLFCDEAAVKARRLLIQGVQAGVYRPDIDVDLSASFIAGAYDRLARQIVREARRPDLRRLLQQVQTLVLRGVASQSLLAQMDRVEVASAVEPRPGRSRVPLRAERSKAPGTNAPPVRKRAQR
jgi:AcrR family transcriptional regulator